MAGPLSMGLGAVFIASLGSAFLPATGALGATMFNVSLYGGLALFSAFVLYDTSKVITHAYERGDDFDPYNGMACSNLVS